MQWAMALNYLAGQRRTFSLGAAVLAASFKSALFQVENEPDYYSR